MAFENLPIQQTSSPLQVPGINPEPIKAHYEPGEVTALFEEQVAKAKNALDSIVSLPKEKQAGALLAFETALSELSDAVNPLYFTSYVYPDAGVAAEGTACEEKHGRFLVDVFTRKDIYDIIRQNPPAAADERRLYDKTVEAFEKNGLDLPPEKLNKVRELKKKLAGLESKFGANLNLDSTTIAFSAAELEGAPQDFLGRLKKSDDGKFVLTMKYPDYEPVMLNVKSGDTRRRMRLAFLNRGAPAENTKLLEEAIATRQEIAQLSGFGSWADYRTSTRLAKDAAHVAAFIANLKPAIIKKSRENISALLEFKRSLEPNASAVEVWDVAYLENQLKKQKYALDDELVREYFPLESVISGLFSIFSTVFGVRFEQVANARTWHPDAQLYRIAEPASGKSLAYVYFDLFPRKGKFGHEAMVTLVCGRKAESGYVAPVVAIVANKNPAAGGKPPLLSHGEVVALFHEFGHALNTTLTSVPYASLSGSNVAWDFVETPSQTLENWPYAAQVIDILSCHYKDNSKMPQGLRDKIVALRDLNLGYSYSVLLAFSQTDLELHTAKGAVDMVTVADSAFLDFTGMKKQEGTNFLATFGHIMGGYDAGYYCYAWSQVFAYDCFAQFEKEGLLNAATGARYRKWVLEQGDMQDGDRLLEGFLGRPASPEALYKRLGITVGSG